MKRQQLFHSFLPGVTAAVLTTQPSWAQTIDIGGVSFVASPNVSTATYSGNSVANDTKAQLPTVTPTAMTTVSHQPVISNSIGVVVTGKTGVPIGPIGQINRNRKDVLFSLTPAVGSSQQPDLNPSTSSHQKQTNRAIRQKSQISTSKLPDSGSPSPKVKNPNTHLPTVLQMPARSAGAAELLQQPQQNTTFTNQLAQANTPTPRVPPANLAPTRPATPATVPTKPTRSGSPINPQVPTTTPPTPTNSTPIVPTTKPARGDSSVQVPEYLNGNPNPLQFPTKQEEVRLQGTQPISLAQALELARRNNQDLQVALLTLQSNQAAVRAAQASLYPTAEISASVTRQGTGAARTSDPLTARQLQVTQGAGGSSSTGFTGTAQVNYPLYTSGQRLARIQQAEEQARFSELSVEQTSEEIRLNVTTGYYDLQSADEGVRINQAAVLNYQASLRDALALEQAGVGTRFDVLRAQVNLANAQQNLTNSLSQQRVVRRQFAVLLNLTQSVDVSAADPVQLAGLWNQTLEESIVLAFQNRPELEKYLAQRNISEQQRREQLATLGPQISLVANYNLQDSFNDNINVRDNYSLGVQASVRLFDGGAARAQADVYRFQGRSYETQFGQQRNKIRLEVEQAYSNLQANLQNVQTSSTALEQSREALRLARLRFQAGVGTQTDVIASESDLTNAEGNRVTAILNYNRALATLQRSVTLRAFR